MFAVAERCHVAVNIFCYSALQCIIYAELVCVIVGHVACVCSVRCVYVCGSCLETLNTLQCEANEFTKHKSQRIAMSALLDTSFDCKFSKCHTHDQTLPHAAACSCLQL